jgi:hypothetical protein
VPSLTDLAGSGGLEVEKEELMQAKDPKHVTM